MPLVAGVDSSTQSTKVVLRDLDDGTVVASASAPHPATTPPRSEQDPAAWWGAFDAAWAAATEGREVAAVSVAAQQHGMVVLDTERRVIRPAKLWNDTESAPDAGWLLAQLPGGAADWAAACGSVPVAAFTITKLSWLHRSEPEAWQRLAHVLLPHDWLTYRLTGELVTDRGDASGTGYWSPAEGAYRFDLLAIVDRDRDWSTVLPRVLAPSAVAGAWNGITVAAGTGDNMGAALGLGIVPGDVVVSLGTSGTVFTVAEAATCDPTGAVAGFADAAGRFLPLVCTLNAAKVTDAVAGWLGVDHHQLDALALSAPPGAGGVALLPYFDGERTPNLPTATGTVLGLRSTTTREQLARAAFEGVVAGLLDGLDALSAHCPTDGRLVVVGGAAASGAYRQVLADLSGRVVEQVAEHELVAAGAAVQAAAALTGAAPAEVAARWAPPVATVTEPSPGVDGAELRAAIRRWRDQLHPADAG